MAYAIEIAASAEREIRKLPHSVAERIGAAIRQLALDPRPRASAKLRGWANRWRVRVGDYRIIYEIHDDRLVVVVVHARHRRDVYGP